MNAASKWSPRAKTFAAFTAGLVLGAFSMFEIVPAGSARNSVAGSDDGTTLAAGDDLAAEEGAVEGDAAAAAAAAEGGTQGAGPATAGGTGRRGGSAGGGATGGSAVASDPSKCNRESNGGATDRGVTKDSIRLATTIVASGPGASFQAEMQYAMEAVVRATNRAGGICGRLLSVEYKDDKWDRQTGAGYLRNFIDSGIFAIPVGASSEGVGALIETREFDQKKIPVVGTDGLEIRQYQDDATKGAQQWVWPVATATVSSARIMAQDAYQRGARSFGVVFERTYKFGTEGADAFRAEVSRLGGAKAVGNDCDSGFCGVQAAQPSYSNEVSRFYKNPPDFIALFLEPDTALTWMRDPNTRRAAADPNNAAGAIRYGYGAAQPLFTDKFGKDCGAPCDRVRVWTGFKPAIESYEGDPAIREYISAVKSVKPNIDYYNQFTQGAYMGMQLLVQALKEVGANLTRERLREVLNHTTLARGLAIQDKLTYTPNSRFANVTMQGYDMQFKGTWGRWRSGPVVRDPRPEAGIG